VLVLVLELPILQLQILESPVLMLVAWLLFLGGFWVELVMERPVDTIRALAALVLVLVLELELPILELQILESPVLMLVAWLLFLGGFWVALASETTTRTAMMPTPMQSSRHAEKEKEDAGNTMASTERFNRICCIENLFRL